MKTLEIKPAKDSSYWSTAYVTQNEICQQLSQCPDVENLSIARNQIGEKSVWDSVKYSLFKQTTPYISPSIKKIAALKNLYALSIANGSLTNEDMACLASNKNLTSLTIIGNQHDFSQGLAAFANHSYLSALHIFAVNVNDVAAKALQNTPLHSLDISSHSITDEGAIALFSNKSLVRISLCMSSLTDQSVRKIIDVLEDQHNLSSCMGNLYGVPELKRIMDRNYSKASDIYQKIMAGQNVSNAEVLPRVNLLMSLAQKSGKDEKIVLTSKKIALATGIPSYHLLQSILRTDLFYFDVDEWMNYYKNPTVEDFWSIPKGEEKAVIVLMVEQGVEALAKTFLDHGDWLNPVNKGKLKQIFSVVPQVDSYLSTMRDFNQMLVSNTLCKHNRPKYVAFAQNVRS